MTISSPPRPKPAVRTPVVRGAVLALVAAGLAAAIALARVDAQWGAPSGPERTLQAIDGGQVPATQRQAKALDILRDRPIDGRAFRVLAATSDRDGDHARASQLYAVAARRAPRDRPTRAALAERAFASGDAAGAMQQLDALLRVGPGFAAPVLQALLPMTQQPGVRGALIARLASDPPWRPALAGALRDPAIDPARALDLLAHIAARTPLTPAERDTRIALWQAVGEDAQARRHWLAALPAELRAGNALLFDGGFEQPQVEGAFAWRQSPPPGVDIGIDSDALEGKQALALVFGGRAIPSPGLQQALALAPGAYRLGFASDNATNAQRPFAWRITCRDGATLLSAQLPTAPPSGWQRRHADFDVPAGCPGQTLRLDLLGRSVVERQLSGTLRIDALRIDRR